MLAQLQRRQILTAINDRRTLLIQLRLVLQQQIHNVEPTDTHSLVEERLTELIHNMHIGAIAQQRREERQADRVVLNGLPCEKQT
jgi:hypothetical protein